MHTHQRTTAPPRAGRAHRPGRLARGAVTLVLAAATNLAGVAGIGGAAGMAGMAGAAGIAVVAGVAVSAPAHADPARQAPAPQPGTPAPRNGSTPSPTPSPTSPSPSPSPGAGRPSPLPSPPGGGDSSGWVNHLVSSVLSGMAGWTGRFLANAVNSALKAMGHTILATPAVTTIDQVAHLTHTVTLVADAGLLLLILAGAVLVSGRETLQVRLGAKQLLPRLIGAAIGINLSGPICDLGIRIANRLSAVIVAGGIDTRTAAKMLTAQLAWDAAGTAAGFTSAYWLLAVIAAILVLLVAATFVGRLVLIVLLVIIAPAALACHALPQTERIAIVWWRAFAACLALQIVQAICLVGMVRLTLVSGRAYMGIPVTQAAAIDTVAVAGLAWAMIKAPRWARMLIFADTPRSGHTLRSMVGRAVQIFALLKTFGLAGAARGASTAVAARPPSVQLHNHAHQHLHAHTHARSPGASSAAGSRSGRGGRPGAPGPPTGRGPSGRARPHGASGTGRGWTGSPRTSLGPANNAETGTPRADSPRRAGTGKSGQGRRPGTGRSSTGRSSTGQPRSGRPDAWRYINPDGSQAPPPPRQPRRATGTRQTPPPPASTPGPAHQPPRSSQPPGAHQQPTRPGPAVRTTGPPASPGPAPGTGQPPAAPPSQGTTAGAGDEDLL